MLTDLEARIKTFCQDEDGLGMLEMILIIAVIVIIAILFRSKLKEIVDSLLNKAQSKTEDFMNDK